jgi:predicted DNA-binding transcriptional regulator AlpA
MISRTLPSTDSDEPPLVSTLKSASAREPNCGGRLLTPRGAADFLRVSESWLAKARMRGDGPPYVKVGRSIRYAEGALLQWIKSRVHLSTSER